MRKKTPVSPTKVNKEEEDTTGWPESPSKWLCLEGIEPSTGFALWSLVEFRRNLRGFLCPHSELNEEVVKIDVSGKIAEGMVTQNTVDLKDEEPRSEEVARIGESRLPNIPFGCDDLTSGPGDRQSRKLAEKMKRIVGQEPTEKTTTC